MQRRIVEICSTAVSATINVVETLDIVLFQILPYLHLNDLQRNLAAILKPMFCADGDVGALVLGDGDHFVIAGNGGGASDNDPVLGAVHVALHAQALAGLDCDALHFEVVGVFQNGIAAPGALHGEMCNVFLGVVTLQGIDHLAHALALATLGDEDGIGGFDDIQVFHTNGGNQALVALDQGVAAIDGDDVALGGVAGCVLVGDFVHRIPATDIRPADVAGDKGNIACLFQHAVIDGDAGHAREVPGNSLGGVAALPFGGDIVEDGRHFGEMVGDLLQDGRGLPDEHAGVPVITAVAEKGFCGGEVRLFGKALHGVHVTALGGTGLDVAEASVRPRWGNAEGDQLAVLRRHHSLAQGGLKQCRLLDDVVRWQNEHDGIVAVARQPGGSQGDGRRGIAAFRFKQGLVGAEGMVGLALGVVLFGDDEDMLARDQRMQAADGGFEQGVAAINGEELLWQLLAGERPQAGAAAAGENYGLDIRLYVHGNYHGDSKPLFAPRHINRLLNTDSLGTSPKTTQTHHKFRKISSMRLGSNLLIKVLIPKSSATKLAYGD